MNALDLADLVYGPAPAATPVTVTQVMQTCSIPGGRLSEWRLEPGPGLPPIWVLLALPERTPAPVCVGLNFGGNHAVHPTAGIRIHDRWLLDYVASKYGGVGNRADAGRRGADQDGWPLELALRRGYGVATACYADIQEDRPGGAGLLAAWAGRNEAQAITAWSWALSRIVDWLTTLPTVDPRCLVCVGHSRLGKTALLTGLRDPRIALAIPSQSGCGGIALSHDPSPQAETVAKITSSFPHWFHPRFSSLTGADQDLLLAGIAPRRALVTNAADDQWADPAGQWRCLRRAAAAAAWGITLPEAMPPVGERVRGPLGWWMRPGGHAQTPAEWRIWLDAADEAFA